MKVLKRMITSSLAVLLAAGMTLNFGGCSKDSPVGPTVDTDQQADFQVLAKKGGKGKGKGKGGKSSTVGSTIEQGSMTVKYSKRKKAYKGGHISLSQGSKFDVDKGSLTPPSELMKQDVTITMNVIQDANNGLVFEFGPSGSHFAPAATVRFRYDGSNPKLYYINNDGSYVEQQPDEVDKKNKWLVLKINHFSRYAVAWAN